MKKSDFLQLSGVDRMLHQGKFRVAVETYQNDGPACTAIFSEIAPFTGGPEFGDTQWLHFYGLSHLFRKLDEGAKLPLYEIVVQRDADNGVVGIEARECSGGD